MRLPPNRQLIRDPTPAAMDYFASTTIPRLTQFARLVSATASRFRFPKLATNARPKGFCLSQEPLFLIALWRVV